VVICTQVVQTFVDPPTRIVVEYSAPTAIFFKMNWGWGPNYYVNTEFAATGNWEITETESNYIYEREMINWFSACN